jgi:hypothetical protein
MSDVRWRLSALVFLVKDLVEAPFAAAGRRGQPSLSGALPVITPDVDRLRSAGDAIVPRGPRTGQDAFTATSSRTKLVCRDESSVPLNDNVTVWPANEDTSNVLFA